MEVVAPGEKKTRQCRKTQRFRK